MTKTVKFEAISMAQFGRKYKTIVVIGEINTLDLTNTTPEMAMLELCQKNHDDYPVSMILG